MVDRKLSMDHILKIALFWGSLWGIAEATLGHVLHWVSVPGLAGSLMFPVGLFCMIRAFKDSGRVAAIMAAASVAASIKCVDFLFPVRNVFSVTNPVLAILCESLAVAGFFALMSGRIPSINLKHIWATALAWRLMYALPIVVLSLLLPVESFLTLGPGHLIRFFVMESAINCVLIYFLVRVGAFSVESLSAFHRQRFFSPVLLFMLAVVLQVFVRSVLR
jgi:hypothetical protein